MVYHPHGGSVPRSSETLEKTGELTMKLKHNQKLVCYTPSDFSQYCHGEQYIHPTIQVGTCTVVDAIEAYRNGLRHDDGDYYAKKAKVLRDATGSTFYLDKHNSFGSELSLKWQSHREGHSGECFYPSLYGCRIDSCGFDPDTIAIASKLAKIAQHGWNAQPLQVVEALKAIKAICVKWHKQADCFVLSDHLADDMFGLPEHLRQGEKSFVCS
jgi:hypothetical protein